MSLASYEYLYTANNHNLSYNDIASQVDIDTTLYLDRYFRNGTYNGGGVFQTQLVPECDNCSRPFVYKYQQNLQNSTIKSSCSDPGTWDSTGQKVISFALYIFDTDDAEVKSTGNKFYNKGLHENVKAMRQLYPGYTIRLYTNMDIHRQGFCKVYCENPDLFWCDVRKSPSLGDQSAMYFTTWRFFPLGDDTVDHFLSRDLDSVVTEREAAVVRDWLKLPEKKAIHTMRDKAEAHNTAVLGGMWGAKNDYFGDGMNNSAKGLFSVIQQKSMVPNFHELRDTGFDQEIISEYMFMPRKHQIVAYDSYHCKEWNQYTMIRPFPMRRKNKESDFVGNTGLGTSKYDLYPCPVECRPSYGQDWTYC